MGDIVFTGLVLRGQRRITVDQFYSALQRIAGKKGVDANAVRAAVVRCSRPSLHCTVPEVVRFHDDKSTYTGTQCFKATHKEKTVKPGPGACDPVLHDHIPGTDFGTAHQLKLVNGSIGNNPGPGQYAYDEHDHVPGVSLS